MGEEPAPNAVAQAVRVQSLQQLTGAKHPPHTFAVGATRVGAADATAVTQGACSHEAAGARREWC